MVLELRAAEGAFAPRETQGSAVARAIGMFTAFMAHLVGDYYGSGAGWALWPLWPVSSFEVMNPHAGLIGFNRRRWRDSNADFSLLTDRGSCDLCPVVFVEELIVPHGRWMHADGSLS